MYSVERMNSVLSSVPIYSLIPVNCLIPCFVTVPINCMNHIIHCREYHQQISLKR